MTYFYALVHKEADSAFGVSFPDLPGVYSAADDADEIVNNAIQALGLWAEDTDLPAPSSLEQIHSHQGVKQELAQGAFLVRIPLIINDSRVVRANVSFETGTLKAIDEAAKERGLSRSAFLSSAARKEILQGG